MNHALDSRRFRTVKKRDRVLDRALVPEHRVVEPDPIGVVENVHAFERFRQKLRMIEIERMRNDLPAELVFPLRRVRERDYILVFREEPARDVFSGVSECARDCVECHGFRLNI